MTLRDLQLRNGNCAVAMTIYVRSPNRVRPQQELRIPQSVN